MVTEKLEKLPGEASGKRTDRCMGVDDARPMSMGHMTVLTVYSQPIDPYLAVVFSLNNRKILICFFRRPQQENSLNAYQVIIKDMLGD